jgi:nitroimidazol reductase NimA-like FMN-containing flavoprotein (pyridoxamine 5'-phosphate oxidase superfamily)
MTDRDRSEADGPHMTPEALAAFLDRPLIARLATSDHDRPRVLPMWYLWDGSDLWMETSPTFPNARVLRENPHAAVAIDETLGGFALRAVVMRGEVELIEQPRERVMEMVRRIYRRYLDDAQLASLEGDRILSARHVLLRLHPAKLITWDTADT